MVVDDVQNDGQSFLVAFVYQTLESSGASVGVLRRKRVSRIVAPVAVSRELRDGHEFDGRYAQFPEFVQAGDDGVEGPFRRVCARVEFIDDVMRQKQAAPGLVFPGETGVDHLGWAVNAVGLKPEAGSGRFLEPSRA